MGESLQRALRPTVTGEGDRVTTLELFFDLVFVFGFTQVTWLVSHGEAPMSVLQGFVIMSLLWSSWASFAWLANQARANSGILQFGFGTVMAAVFVMCLAIPEAFHHGNHGLDAAAILVAGYLFVRLVHLTLYTLASDGDTGLQRRLLMTGLTSGPSFAAMIVGVWADDPARTWIWIGAVVWDWVVIYLGARSGGWAIHSVEHFAERHGLVVILALGESVVAIGVGVAREPLHTNVLIGAVLAIAISIGMWWQYFRQHSDLMEEGIAAEAAEVRPRSAAEVFTYLHGFIVIGIIFAAVGLEQAMAHLDDAHLGALGGWCLGAGVATMIIATALAVARASGRWFRSPLVAGALVVASSPVLAEVTPLNALAIVAGILSLTALVEEVA